MSSENQHNSFIPVTVIGLSLVAFFIWNLVNISQQRTNLSDNKKKLEELYQTNIPKLDEQVTKSKLIQDNVAKLATDLLLLAKTDADAKEIVTKYGIQQNTPAPSASDKK